MKMHVFFKSSICSGWTTLVCCLLHHCRLIFRNAVNASEYDCVIFTGSGTTGAVNLLIHAMGLHRAATGSHKRLVVFHGLFEHHSNLLPWRELGAEVSGSYVMFTWSNNT